jgi:diguanylate cyclase (GGDEF)-like protein
MVGTAGSVQFQQLLELLAVMSSFSDQESAVRGAVERAAQAFEAEVAAVIVNDRVVASIGFPAGATPDDDLLAVARRELDSVAVPRLGGCHAVSAGWGGAHPGHLVLARFDDPFAVEERSVVRGMARILELSLTMLRSVETLRQRQRLLEHLFNIQRAISRRQPLDQILSGVTSAARDLLGDEIVGLWLMDPADPDQIRLVAHIGLSAELAATRPVVPIAHAGAAGGAISSENLVVHHGNPHPSMFISRLTNGRLCASMAAPVHDSGTVTGSLLVGSYRPDRTYTSPDMQTLRAFAEHISLALTDANTVDRMHQAFHDSLTGLASRGLFIDRLSQQLRLAGHAAERVALLFVDLDRFKEINDTLGHAAGDTMLTTTAQRLKSQLRETDIAARFGGDEFAILLGRVTTTADAATVAERILRALDQPLLVGGRQLQINASIGIALSAPGRLDPSELIRNADIAMYQAKRNGRGCYATFTDDMQLSFTGEGC